MSCFSLLWEIKRLHSLPICAHRHHYSFFLCCLRHLLPPLVSIDFFSPACKYLSGLFLPTFLCCSLSDVSRAVDSSHADNYQPEKNVTGARICGGGSSAMCLNNNNSIWGFQNYSRTLQNPLSNERTVYLSFRNSRPQSLKCEGPLLSCPSFFLLLFVYS